MGEALLVALCGAVFVVLAVAVMTIRDLVLWIGRKRGWEIIVLRIPTEHTLLFPPRHPNEPPIAIGPVTWRLLQEQVKESLAATPDAHPDVLKYWLRIAEGKVPPHLFLFDPKSWQEPRPLGA
jgi:hypothetical protein